ncbi:electron transfer flavoprotein-ubiquinone oxidoreductase [Planctomycetota bacterium]|nr:electron transfer flavoprotein-ubiquinone oxidoreductase [Planctomycetota bacterium]
MSDDEIERDELPCGVLFVGAGPANLAGAIRLADLCNAHNEAIEKGGEGEAIDLDELSIMVIEKADAIGDHSISGACLDPKAIQELIPDYKTLAEPGPCPIEGDAQHDSLVVMTKTGKIKAPILPPTFNNHGNHLVSLNKLTKWLGEIAEEKGVQVLPGFPGAEVLYNEDGSVKGVRTVDRGVDKHGAQNDSFEPGTDIEAMVTIFGEGSRGSLSRSLVKKFKLDEGRNPQIYSTGCKELWKVKPGSMKPGEVIHTAGYPLKIMGDEFGGGFIYSFADDHVSLGFVVSLDSPDPYLDPHRLFSEWKSHPMIAKILEGGEVVRFGAKTIPEGGWFSVPRPYGPGFMMVGDSAGYLNMTRLKGIHLAMKSGMIAAEQAFQIMTGKIEATEEGTKGYWKGVLDSWLFEEMWKVRNFRQLFQRKKFGFMIGGALAGLHIQSGGLWPPGRLKLQGDHHRIRRLTAKHTARAAPPEPVEATVDAAAKVAASRKNGVRSKAPKSKPADAPEPSVKTKDLVFDKVTDVYHAGATHEEDQPPHLVIADMDICHTRCAEEYGNPCQYFCPAAVYEMVDTDDQAGRKLQLNFSNCVHCKTCDVRDPYQIITWVTPQGGGPNYAGL